MLVSNKLSSTKVWATVVIATLCFSQSIMADTISNANLFAQYSFETSSGATVGNGDPASGQIDESGGNVLGPFHAIPFMPPPGLSYSNDVPGGIGSSYSLNFPAPETGNNFVSVPMTTGDALSSMTQGDFRIEAWFKTTDTGRAVLAGSYSGAANALNLELHTLNRGRLYVQGSQVMDLNLTLPTDSRDGAWHQLVGTREAGLVSLFYDGGLVGTYTGANVAGDYDINKPLFYFGRDGRGTPGSTAFAGNLDDIRFYNSADTSALVAAYEFETAGGAGVSNGQLAIGQVDENNSAFHGTASPKPPSAFGQYSSDTPPTLTTSSHSYVVAEDGSAGVVDPTTAFREVTQGDFAVEGWFKTTDTGRNVLFGGCCTGAPNGFNLELHTGDRVRLWISGTSQTTDHLVAAAPARDGEWHHLLGQRTIVGATDVTEIYLDGVLVATRTDTTPAGSFSKLDTPYFIGRDSRTAAEQFNGSLDDIRVWTRTLTLEEIQILAAGGSPQVIPEPSTLALAMLALTGLVAGWRRRREN